MARRNEYHREGHCIDSCFIRKIYCAILELIIFHSMQDSMNICTFIYSTIQFSSIVIAFTMF
jgi:hypothetical protein